MGNKANWLEAKGAELLQKLAINLAAACAGPDQIHDQMLALDQVRPDLVLLRRRGADHGRAAHASEIATLLTEDLHANNIAVLQFSFGRTDIGELTALARRDDHEFVTLGPADEERSEQRSRQLHLTHAHFRRTQGSSDGIVRKLAQQTQQRQFTRRLDLARFVEDPIGSDPANA